MANPLKLTKRYKFVTLLVYRFAYLGKTEPERDNRNPQGRQMVL